jgi:hypothetical protein
MVGRNGTPSLRRLESMCSMSAPDRRGASNRLGADVVHWQQGRWLDQQYNGHIVLLLFLPRTITIPIHLWLADLWLPCRNDPVVRFLRPHYSDPHFCWSFA